MVTLIMILGIMTFAILVIGLGVFAGGAICLLLAKMLIPVIILFAIIKIVARFFGIGGRV